MVAKLVGIKKTTVHTPADNPKSENLKRAEEKHLF